MYFTAVKKIGGHSLAVQWLGLCFHCQGPGSIPGQGTKIPQPCGMDKKKKKTWEKQYNRKPFSNRTEEKKKKKKASYNPIPKK